MIVPDTNLLVYAVHGDNPEHALAKQWLDDLLTGDELVGLPWVVVLGFVRFTTNRRVMPSPWPIEDALALVDQWYAQPVVSVIEPGDSHWRILRTLLAVSGRGGNLTTDAHLAALCIERGATLHSADSDFSRFKSLHWVNPLRV